MNRATLKKGALPTKGLAFILLKAARVYVKEAEANFLLASGWTLENPGERAPLWRNHGRTLFQGRAVSEQLERDEQ